MRTIKRAISLVLIMTILALANIPGVAAASKIKFTDVKNTAWYYSAVTKLVDLGITNGIGNNKFGPDLSVTKAEFVTFLCKGTGLAKMKGYDFKDTEKHWAREWITAAVTAKIIEQGTYFKPNQAITRQEAVEMMCRALNLQADTTMQTPYVDVKTNPGYSNTAYKEYLMSGSVTKGKRYFNPSSKISRAETATVIVNMVDYKADPDKYKSTKKSKEELNKTETERYNTWLESIKTFSPELLSNTEGLIRSSVYDSYKYLKTETDYFKVWGDQYGMNEDEFAKEMVRVGSKFMNTWYNANYSKVDKLETDLKSVMESNDIRNDLQRNLEYVKNNKFVSEGNFITSTGLLVFADWGNPVLRGTIKYRYLSPTSSAVLESETVGSTGKHIELGVWYEQDFEIIFVPEKDGLKCTRMRPISDIRVTK